MATHPWPPATTGFAATISGLPARSVDQREVTEAVKSGIYNSAAALDFTAEGKANLLDSDGMAEDLLLKISESAVAIPRDPPGSSPTSLPTQWAIYTMPVTSNHSHWEEWIGIVSNIPIVTDIGIGNKNGAIRIHCQVCQSVDHTRDYCSYPKLEGWVPQVKLTEERSNRQRTGRIGERSDRGRGRGGRGGSQRTRPY